jgi:hypothetical protein
MTKTFVFHDTISSSNSFSQKIEKEKPIQLIAKANFDFSKQSKIYDAYRDNLGTIWVLSYEFGKSQDDAEYKLWTTWKTPATADDAKYIVENLNKSEALELFETIVGKTNKEILSGFSKALKLPRIISIEKTKPRISKPYNQQLGRKTGKGKGKIGKEHDFDLGEKVYHKADGSKWEITRYGQHSITVTKVGGDGVSSDISEQELKENFEPKLRKSILVIKTKEAPKIIKSFKPTRTTYNRQKIKGMEAPTLKKQGRDAKDKQQVQTTIKEGVIYDEDLEKSRKQGAKDKQKRKAKFSNDDEIKENREQRKLRNKKGYTPAMVSALKTAESLAKRFPKSEGK